MKKFSPLSRNFFIRSFALFAVVIALGTNTLFAQQKVVGGVDVDIKDYPWQVALTSSPNGSGFCGGSIIGDSWVLTAAHCVNNDSPSGLYIRGGSSSSFASGGDSYSVAQIIVHPNYLGDSYDFALIEINGEFEYGENMQKIDLIDEAEIALGAQDGGVMSTITGWGTTSSGGSLADILQMVEAPIVDNNVACGSASDANGNSGQYNCPQLDESMICAGDLVDGGEDACQGDSGGPLVVRSSDNSRWLLIGATSWGNGCADVAYPGVWSKVSHVLDWINENAVVGEYVGLVYGCTDSTAINYSPEATENDGSCEYSSNCDSLTSLDIFMSDSFGDGWNGNILSINEQPFSLESGSEETASICYDESAGCVSVTCDGGLWQTEVSWTIIDEAGNLLLSGGAPFVGGFGGDDCAPVYGCLDTLALNYDELANTEDGSCEYPLVGCMDPAATNYTPGADFDDGSCEYSNNCESLTATAVLIEVGGGTYDSEISWAIGQFSGVAESVQVCLEHGCQTFTMFDSYGDGWNNASVNITGPSGDLLLNGTLEGFTSQGTLSFGLNTDESCGPVYGCLDSTALNYNELANTDDGSCIYPVVGCMDTLALNFNPEAGVDDGSCEYPINCDSLTAIIIEVGGGSWTNEVSWELGPFSGVVGSTEACIEEGCYEFIMNDSWGDGWNGNIVTISTDDEVLVSGTLDSGSQGVLLFSYNTDCGYISGCMDLGAINYNPDAIMEDGSCLYPIFGCTDTTAINVNLEATDDDGSCYFDYDILGCTDETALNYNLDATYNDETCEYPFSCADGYVLDCDGSEECHSESWIGDGFADCEDQQWGADLTCYDNDGGDCGDSFEELFGCTDPDASNYNPQAIEDDGSCEYPNDCDGLSNLLINMTDSYGDGWNGAEISVNGQVFTIIDGSQETSTACADLTSECIEVTCSEGLYPSEVSWTISDTDGNELLSGGAPYQGGIGECGGVVVDPIFGCMDDSALNYNQDATEDDGSCEYTGCPYPNYFEYNPNYTIPDALLCITLIVEGCTNDTAENFNPEANLDDETCVILGCIFETADNYNPEANQEDGSCIYFGCINPTADNYDALANEEDGSCIIYGCILVDFPNYNSEATIDDFSCDMSSTDVFGCINPSYLEYDPIVNTDNGTCSILVVNGCTDETALNYNADANTDDGSCIAIVNGCTDVSGCNYNSEANVDDGTCEMPELSFDCYGNCLNDFDMDGECDEVDYDDGIGIDDIESQEPLLIRMIDILGREQHIHADGVLLFYLYDNGKVEKILKR